MLQGEPGLHPGAAGLPRLDHHGPGRHTAHHHVAPREVGFLRRGLGPELRDHGPTFSDDAPRQLAVLRRVHASEDPGTDDRDGPAAGIEGGGVRRSVDPAGQAGQDGDPGRGQASREPRGAGAPLLGGLARADHGDGPQVARLQLPAQPEEGRAVEDQLQVLWVIVVQDRDQSHILRGHAVYEGPGLGEVRGPDPGDQLAGALAAPRGHDRRLAAQEAQGAARLSDHVGRLVPLTGRGPDQGEHGRLLAPRLVHRASPIEHVFTTKTTLAPARDATDTPGAASLHPSIRAARVSGPDVPQGPGPGRMASSPGSPAPGSAMMGGYVLECAAPDRRY